MFDKTARYYDLFYEHGLGKDYTAEATMVAELLPGATTLLDVACGTGLHLQHLRTRFECTGIDLDEGMLAIARERCPDLPLVHGDMIDFDLGRTFDAVICLFSSIAYVRTPERLQQAVATMVRHLAPGGTLLVEPWLTPEMIKPGHVGTLHVDLPDLKMTRMNSISVADGISTLHFHYLIGTATGIEHLVETHETGLFTWDEYRDAFERAGLDTTVETEGGPMGRGLLTGRS
jgi:ubiquinone/menaquinone biosynthesis C-methylase UbiE